MKTFLIILQLLLLPFLAYNQNLVPNGDFEQYSGCPGNTGHLDSALFWVNPNAFSTPDYLNENCPSSPTGVFGYQQPHSGVAYAGFYLGNPTSNSREYAEVPLINPLIAGKCYHLEFYASAGHNNFTTDALHAYFSDTLITGVPVNNLFQFVPQIMNTAGNFIDTLNWTLISGDFVSNGGEHYLILGNFLSYNNTSYLQIANDPCCPSAYGYIDDVSLIETTCTGIEENEVFIADIYPNPAYDKLHVVLNNYAQSIIQVFNGLSQTIFQEHFSHKIDVDVNDFSSGLYFYQIENGKGKYKTGKFLIK